VRSSRPPSSSCPSTGQQWALTTNLIDAAGAAGRQRLADNHRRVAANLDKIITALENLPQAGAEDD
jgi:hypothetical protein